MVDNFRWMNPPRSIAASAEKLIAALLAAAGLSLAAADARADLFDFLRPKRTAVEARAQSPDGKTFGAGTYSPRNLWQPQSASANQSTPAGGNVPSSWGTTSAPADDYANYDFSGGGPTVNCGECDPDQWKVSLCRKMCHQTYYPRSAPYCQSDWGWNQTCWRRMKDNYNCPRPDWHGSCPEPPAPLSPQTPVMPPATTYLPPPRNPINRQNNQPASYSGQQRQSFSRQPPNEVRANVVANPESTTDASDWEYQEDANSQPATVPQRATAPPREQSRAGYYQPPGVSR